MNLKSKWIVANVLIFSFLLAICVMPAMAEKKAKKATIQTIEGTVTELSRDEKGNVNSVSIKTGEEAYEVLKGGKKVGELFGLVGKTVEVTGKIQEKKGKKTIKMASYKVLEK